MAWFDAITRITHDPELSGSLVRHGLEFAATRSWDHVASEMADLIEREATTPRVLVLAPEARGIGGIQRVTRSLTEALSESFGEDRIGVLSLRRGDQALRGRVLREGVRARSGRVPFVGKIAFATGSAWTARRWRRRLALVAAHPHLAPVAWAAHVMSGAPYAVWCHGIESWGRMSPLVAEALRRADVVFAPSRFTARRVEEVAGLRAGSVQVVPHPCPPITDASTGERSARPRVLTVARLTPENRYKGVDLVLRAWPKVRAEVDAELMVIGDGPDLGYLRGIARDEGVEDSVRFAGRVSDQELATAYGSASVFALPARHRLEPRRRGRGSASSTRKPVRTGCRSSRAPGAAWTTWCTTASTGCWWMPGSDGHRSGDRRAADGPGAGGSARRGRAAAATTEYAPERFRARIEALVREDLRPRGLVT